MTIHEMQNLNRAAIEYASTVIVPSMTLVLQQFAEKQKDPLTNSVLIGDTGVNEVEGKL